MSLGINILQNWADQHGPTRTRIVAFTFDTAGSAGWTLAPATLAFSNLIFDVREIGTDTGYILKYSIADGKLYAYECAGAGAPMSKISDSDLNAATIVAVVSGW